MIVTGTGPLNTALVVGNVEAQVIAAALTALAEMDQYDICVSIANYMHERGECVNPAEVIAIIVQATALLRRLTQGKCADAANHRAPENHDDKSAEPEKDLTVN